MMAGQILNISAASFCMEVVVATSFVSALIDTGASVSCVSPMFVDGEDCSKLRCGFAHCGERVKPTRERNGGAEIYSPGPPI